MKAANAKTLRQGIRAMELEAQGFMRWQIGVILRVDDIILSSELEKQNNLLPCNARYQIPKYNEKDFQKDMLRAKKLFGTDPSYRYLFAFTELDNQQVKNHNSNNAKRAIDTAKQNVDAILNTVRSEGELGFGKFPVSASS